jgi:AraC-like DNA-binding protein/ketosteroid isomerase-like protein
MRATEFVESYIDAWNHHDPKGVADHFTADGIYCDVPVHVQRSHDELISFLGDFFTNYRHRYDLIGDILTGGDTIAFQYKVCPLESAESSTSPNAYRGAEFITLHGNAAMTITDYYDIPGIGQPSTPAELSSGHPEVNKYAKSGLSSEQLLEFKGRLERIMQLQQLFLRSDLTLPMLSGTVGCSVNHLSQVINSGFDMSFFDYLNRYRIEYAKELLSRREGRGGAILNIAFTVGFNSNSAFYAAFKKRVGQTPAQYRRANLNQLQ